MRRLILVYSPNSAGYERVRKEVIEKARDLDGWMIGKYVIKPASVKQNAYNLARILQDGDLVVAAGGDGTASAAVNGVIKSQKSVTFAALGFGNFNDLAHTLGAQSLDEIVAAYEDQKIMEMWPLKVSVNDEFWRYAACYVTVGLLADSTEVFDQKAVREKLKKHQSHRLTFSLFALAKWYFQSRQQREFLPKVYLNGQERSYAMTDYLAINSKKVANIMKGNDCYLKPDVFWRAMFNLKSVSSLFAMMCRSVLRRVPGKEVMSDILEFKKPARVSVQVEGEYHRLHKVHRITIDKSETSVKVVKLS